MNLLKEVRNEISYIVKMRRQKGIGGFLRRKPVMINQAEWNKDKMRGKKNENKEAKRKPKLIVMNLVAKKRK